MGIKGRPVSSLEEARATSIDFDGSVFYFPDLANKRIYTKQINMDGTATLNVYEYKPMPDPQKQTYITREEFESVIKQLRDSFLATQPQQQQMVMQPQRVAQPIATQSQPTISAEPAVSGSTDRQTERPQFNF